MLDEVLILEKLPLVGHPFHPMLEDLPLQDAVQLLLEGHQQQVDHLSHLDQDQRLGVLRQEDPHQHRQDLQEVEVVEQEVVLAGLLVLDHQVEGLQEVDHLVEEDKNFKK